MTVAIFRPQFSPGGAALFAPQFADAEAGSTFTVQPAGQPSSLALGSPTFSFTVPVLFAVSPPGQASTLATGTPSLDFDFEGDIPSDLIVEDGTGLPDAESYASVADADAYWARRDSPAAWTGLTTVAKDAKLRRATEYLQAYGSRWKGQQLTQGQALAWPRRGVVVDCFSLDPSVIPTQLVRAVCELALKAATGQLMTDETAQIKSETIGPIETVYADGARQQTRYAYVETMLGPLMKSSNTIRAVRC